MPTGDRPLDPRYILDPVNPVNPADVDDDDQHAVDPPYVPDSYRVEYERASDCWFPLFRKPGQRRHNYLCYAFGFGAPLSFRTRVAATYFCNQHVAGDWANIQPFRPSTDRPDEDPTLADIPVVVPVVVPVGASGTPTGVLGDTPPYGPRSALRRWRLAHWLRRRALLLHWAQKTGSEA